MTAKYQSNKTASIPVLYANETKHNLKKTKNTTNWKETIDNK